MAMELKVEGDETILVLSGEVDMKSTPDLKKMLGTVETTRNLVVIAEELNYIDSSGVACLLMAYKTFLPSSSTIILRRPNDALLSVLKILKFDSLFTVET